MASVAGLVDTFRRDVLRGKHQEGDQWMMAVYTAYAALHPSTTFAYTPANEAKGEGYPPGGVPIGPAIAGLYGPVATLDWENPVIDPATLEGRYILIYNGSLPGKDAAYIGDLGKTVRSTNGPWTPGFPPPGGKTSLIQW